MVLIAISRAMIVDLGYPVDQGHSQCDRLEKLCETGLQRLDDAVMEEVAVAGPARLTIRACSVDVGKELLVGPRTVL
jgi:hypothetical protein